MNHLQVNTTEFITTQGNAFEIICHAQVILSQSGLLILVWHIHLPQFDCTLECMSYISVIVVLLRIGIAWK